MSIALADASHRERPHSSRNISLIVGRKIRCPRCLNVADMLSYFVFDRPEEFEPQLNPVLKCRAKVLNRKSGKIEACRCVFSLSTDNIETSEQVAA